MAGPTAGWKVTTQNEATEPGPGGNLVSGYRIYFQTADSNTGSVFVPMTVYSNVDAVKQMIADQVAAVTAVAGLSG